MEGKRGLSRARSANDLLTRQWTFQQNSPLIKVEETLSSHFTLNLQRHLSNISAAALTYMASSAAVVDFHSLRSSQAQMLVLCSLVLPSVCTIKETINYWKTRFVVFVWQVTPTNFTPRIKRGGGRRCQFSHDLNGKGDWIHWFLNCVKQHRPETHPVKQIPFQCQSNLKKFFFSLEPRHLQRKDLKVRWIRMNFQWLALLWIVKVCKHVVKFTSLGWCYLSRTIPPKKAYAVRPLKIAMTNYYTAPWNPLA